jgi:hypothetical protein
MDKGTGTMGFPVSHEHLFLSCVGALFEESSEYQRARVTLEQGLNVANDS